MPNFDPFERLVRYAMVSRKDELGKFKPQFAAINSENRPQNFKNMSDSQFLSWLDFAHQYLRNQYGNNVNFVTSDANKFGSDIEIPATGIQIELKTGLVTNANLGVGTIAWAMGDEKSNELKEIVNGKEMTKRHQLYVAGKFDDIKESQERAMSDLLAYFRSRVTEKADAPHKLEHLSKCVARGITTLSEFKKLLNIKESDWNSPVILHTSLERGWDIVSRVFQTDENLFIDRIFRSDQSQAIPRAQVQIKGKKSNITARIYPNYKNSHSRNGIRIPAENWVKNPCFHVWIYD